MTKRLYYDETYRTRFDAVVIDISSVNNHPALILSETCFYPTSGGQPYDTGEITDPITGQSIQVIDVMADPNGDVLHVLTSTEQSLHRGSHVSGTVSWDRRYDHMQQHTGQHLLSALFARHAAAETASVHFGARESTLDLQRNNVPDSLLSDEQLADIEGFANEIVYQNLPVRAYFVDESELAHYPLRRPPTVTGQIRVVEIDKLDYSACGGTHCAHTGELGPIKILKQERRRKHARVTFVCGKRALVDYGEKHEIISKIASMFSNEPDQSPRLVESMLNRNRQLNKEVGRLKKELLDNRASKLWENSESLAGFRIVSKFFESDDIESVKQLVSIIQARPEAIIVFGVAEKEKLVFFFARGVGVPLHMSELLNETVVEYGGVGGGRPDYAQGGGVPANTAESVLETAVKQVRVALTSSH